mgnify:CR=1 FL=1
MKKYFVKMLLISDQRNLIFNNYSWVVIRLSGQ